MTHQSHDPHRRRPPLENAAQRARMARIGDLRDHIHRGVEIESSDQDLRGLDGPDQGAGDDAVQAREPIEEGASLRVHTPTTKSGQAAAFVALRAGGLCLFVADQNPFHRHQLSAPPPACLLFLILGLGCYRHGAAHLPPAPAPAPRVTQQRFLGWSQDGLWLGEAIRTTERGQGSLVRLELSTRTATSTLEVATDSDGRPRELKATLRFSGVRRGLIARRTSDGLSVSSEGEVVSAPRTVAWGDESGLEAGHPLLWGPLAARAPSTGRAALRVVRVDPRIPSGVEIDHFVLERRGQDGQGHRIWVETRRGPVALWVNEKGEVVRARWSRDGEPEEWRAATATYSE